MRTATPPMPLTDGQREILENLSRSRTAPHRQVQRARALLLAGQGLANTAIAVQVGVAPSTVQAWRDRFAEQGLVKFGEVATGRGRKPSISEDKIAEIVRATQETTPPGQTHWSCRAMAKAQGVSPATVQRIWSARGLKPHLVKTFKLSNDPKFEEKLIDVVGLYLNPPEGAVVLCMDEKSSVQRLDRGLLIHAQHHGALRRVEVEPDDVDELLFELRVVGQLEGLDQVRLQASCRPDPLHRGGTDALCLCHRAAAPVRLARRGRLLRGPHDLGDLVLRDRRFAPPTRGDLTELDQALLGEPIPPGLARRATAPAPAAPADAARCATCSGSPGSLAGCPSTASVG